jgi:hypothetical protein
MNISRYESAFRMLADSNTSALSDATRVALVAVALNVRYSDNKHQAGVVELFSPRWSPSEVFRCLDEILRLETRSMFGSGVPGLAASPTYPGPSAAEAAALSEQDRWITSMLSDIERRHRCPEPEA